MISWIQTCLIVHSFAAHVEDERYESDFWEWIDEGMSGEDREEEISVEGFRWNGTGQPVCGETDAQWKHHYVQEALFHALY